MNVAVSKIKPNPKNPRVIKDDKFEKLKKSIQEFPEMLEKRPLVCFTDVDGKFVVLGGNMRLKASKELGLKKLPIILADDWTEEQRQEFLIKDNVGFGEWDWNLLANEWNSEDLEAWGLDVPNWNQQDYSEKNKEIDVDDYEDTMTLVLKFNEDDYHLVKDKLLHLASTPEQAIFKLLGLTENE